MATGKPLGQPTLVGRAHHQQDLCHIMMLLLLFTTATTIDSGMRSSLDIILSSPNHARKIKTIKNTTEKLLVVLPLFAKWLVRIGST